MFSTNPEEEKSFNELLRELDEQIANTYNPEPGTALAQLKNTFATLADLVGLEHIKGNVYRNKHYGQHFIRTGYGFQPATLYNQVVRNRIFENELDTLQDELYKVRQKNGKHKHKLNLLKQKLERAKGRNISKDQLIKTLEAILGANEDGTETEKLAFFSEAISSIVDSHEESQPEVNTVDDIKSNTKSLSMKKVLKAEERVNELSYLFSKTLGTLEIMDRRHLKIKLNELLNMIQNMKRDTL